MSRRSLRSIDSKYDLSRHLLVWEQLPQPWNTATLFCREAPLEVEVGSGKGLFLAEVATHDPAADYLGIEMAAKYAHIAAARLVRRGLTNARLLHGDALRVFRELLPADTLRAVHVYFPDPWWKARHKKRRVLNEAFVHDVERVLQPAGSLHFWTDVEEYFHTTLALLAAETRLQGPLAVEEKAADHEMDYRTHFERRTRLHGRAVYRAEFKKIAR